MNFIVHADDFGRSRGITKNISQVFPKSPLTSVSIPVTGYAFEEAIKECKKNRHLRVAVHLDLFENRPVAPTSKVGHLINKDGEFSTNFASLWFKYLLSTRKGKNELRRQVRYELHAQLLKFRKAFSKNFKINIDSHTHMHMVPFVFDELMALTKDFNITYLRLGVEPFFISIESFQDIKNYLGLNIIKHIILNFLGKRYKSILIKKGIKTCDHFIGVLFTGGMTVNSVKKALEKIEKRTVSSGEIKCKEKTVEILFHIGKAAKGEEHLWKRSRLLLDYYYSPRRDSEREALTSETFKKILHSFK